MLAENPRFLALTRQRAVSGWNCYFRSLYPRWADYPAQAMLDAFESASREQRSARGSVV